MSIIKILKNVSGVEKQLINTVVLHNQSFTVPFHLWFELLNNAQIYSDIESGLLIVNNGTDDLTPAEGLKHIRKFHKEEAKDVIFEPPSGFLSANLQSALSEIQQRTRFSIVTTFNGTVGNQWLGYNELIPGNTTPIIIPRKCKLQEITFSWNGTLQILGGVVNVVSSIDGKFDLYKNSTTIGSGIVFTRTFVNSNTSISKNINVEFNEGDIIIGRWTDQGDNPLDAAICYYFEPIG